MPRLHYTALSPEQLLDAALGERTEIIARPRPTPREVFAAWLGNGGVGIGGGIVAGVALYVAGAPDTVLWSGSLLTGATVFAGMMIWYGSQDERADWRNVRRVKRAVKAIEAHHAGKVERLQAQLDRALDALDEADQVEAQLNKALDTMTRERDMAIYDLTNERKQAAQRSNGNSTFVSPRELAPQDVQDATRMIRHYYDTGEHPSKDKSVDRWKWSEDRWKTAQSVLVDARVMAVNKTQAKWIAQSIDEAFRLMGEYMLHVKRLSVPTVNKTLGVVLYVESEDD